ncbi:MAG: FAD-dependent oxidoreductase [Candidatus Gracilibacteria bacterium]|nr:FAD-dependent oxidoreductase [Candidatus Gracilibacteria bacterium]
MGFSNYKLLEKKKLTNDVYEMIFSDGNKTSNKPGQFMTFMLPKTGFGRAYSICETSNDKYIFIIKRVENGRGGSIEITDLEIGSELKAVGPSGHFILKENNKAKIFFATGVGLAPLYNQLQSIYDSGLKYKTKLIFGLKNKEDLFYIDKFEKLKEKIDFEYKIYLSKENDVNFEYGHITNFITKENIDGFEEFYICGNNMMMDECISKLENLGFSRENIHNEKF